MPKKPRYRAGPSGESWVPVRPSLPPSYSHSPSSESAQYPPSSTRLSLAKLFVEISLYASSLEILQRLENEDDEDAEVWYLSGWAWWLLGEKRGDALRNEEEESREECWSEGKLCLENYLRVSSLCGP